MATVAAQTAQGKTSHNRRKSRRISAACTFLSNISLDGNIVKATVKPELEFETPRVQAEDLQLRTSEDDLLDRVGTNQDTRSHRHKLAHSFSASDACPYSEEKNMEDMCRERSTTSTPPVPIHVSMRRSVSMSDSTTSSDGSRTSQGPRWQPSLLKPRVSLLSGSLFHSKRRVNDKRIVLSSGHRVPCVTYSILRYHKKPKEHGPDHSSHGVRRGTSSHIEVQSSCIDGVEICTGGKAVSYRSFLVPTYSWIEKSTSSAKSHPASQLTVDVSAAMCGSPYHARSTTGDASTASTMATDGYDALLLDDPELTSGRHRTVLKLSSFVVSTIAYAKPSELKKDLNEQFHEKFPNINITLTKLRSLKKDLVKIATAQDCQLDLSTVAYAFVYFEKLVLKEKINRANRKLIAGSCLLLAAKLNDDFKRDRIKKVIEEIEDRFRVNLKELLQFEFQVLVALEFNLHIPRWEVIPHFKRLQSIQL